GSKIGSGVTDENGLCTIVVPSRDNYLISIDTASLPDGLTMIDANKSTVSISKDLFTTNTKRVTFFTGQGAESGASEFERILQRLTDGIRLGLIIAMCSVGLSLVFGTTGLTNFAHGEMVTFGGLMAFYFNVILEIPILMGS
ncbi:MAG: branched-chain amino acid ABC transporter permease, partial [Acidimicrobiia bacterium]|nr:branched-chain amino acid ABC transporter permease [Acidimicrobiia bacterium]